MGAFFGAVSKREVALDVFFGVDYHSHLGTRRAGMVSCLPEGGFQREIHSIENTPFRTRFEHDLPGFHGNCAMGCISDSDPQPVLVRSHLGLFAIATVGAVNNAAQLVETFSHVGHQFMAQSSGEVNTTELIAALINTQEDLISGIQYAQEQVEGSLTLLIMRDTGELIAARDPWGRLPVLIGKDGDGYCVTFESFAYGKLGYVDEYELGSGEIVRITADGYETLVPARDEMRICAFLWVYYGYPKDGDSPRRGLRRRRARLGPAARHRLCDRGRHSLCAPLRQVHAHVASLVHARRPVAARPHRAYEADSRARADQRQEAAVRR